MRDIWITSDTHFHHSNILNFTEEDGKPVRPFKTVEEMDETLIENWNKVVKQGDKVYHLGDVFFGDKDWFKKTWPRLMGSKRLIVGNHDDIKFLSSGGFFQKVQMWRIFKEHNLVLTHVPIQEESFGKVEYNAHGHIHRKKPPSPQHINMCVEVTNYTPVHIEEVISERHNRLPTEED